MSLIGEQLEKNRKNFIIAGAVILAVLIIASAVYVYNRRAHVYYAVFLANEQVYFGNLSDINDKYVTLKNGAYLQSQDPNDPQKVGLVRRGTEIHLPTGEMKINRDSIIFIEELTKNSPVAVSINEYEKSQAK